VFGHTLLQTDWARPFEAYYHRLTGGSYSLWRVGLELLLIGTVVYLTLRFLQGTRGARLMRAIGSILVVSFIIVRLVAHKLELERINHLYPYFLGGVFLITLVVFQTELRRGLLRLGENWWSRAWAREAERLVDPVVQAIVRLSKNKVGALIAVERGVGMAGVAETGARLDAEVSEEILLSIFWPGSVLHDMGVIIRQGRVAAASCQFPLADSDDVDRSLGSRHRAAVGMSQESDALVIVVSEETGTISVAEHGRLRRALTPESLRQLLRDGLSARRKRRRPPTPSVAPADTLTDAALAQLDAPKPSSAPGTAIPMPKPKSKAST
jgi:diadenylate cyclase